LTSENPYEQKINELKRLLDIKSGLEVGMVHPISKTLLAIDKNHKAGKKIERNALIGKIYMLIEHLQKIEKHDPSLFEYFREKLKKTTDHEYFGERLEINIAAFLINKKIPFKKSESPDFKKVNGQDINIECTSSHLTYKITSDKGIEDKIRKTIRNKAKKSYSKLNTALFVDITNLYYASLGFDSAFFRDKEDTRAKILKRLLKTSFGSILTFTYLYEIKSDRYYSAHLRIDSDKIDKNLKMFLDKTLPLGHIHIDENIILGQG